MTDPVFATRSEAESALFRIQEGLGGMPPGEYEEAYSTREGQGKVGTLDRSPTGAR
ncbi:hypothetical protein [Streptomonospora salina]|uniref:Uncharacterized protein n=1 Tax=Streptomonospora salina TaxID=104205 RepID=A0A841E5W8_9ACTN|nr:hypothetical protein [Streptomonospora salina]MBB5996543.1 hypothetical protein [Streptomonospora salina]